MTVSEDKSYAESLTPDDGGIHVYQDGPREAPALLLIHGTAASAASWEPILPLLTGSHRVIRIDLPGCGRSAHPADASYAVPDQARRAAAVLDRLGIESACVIGHSSGGVVATALTEQRPDLVRAVVLIGTGPDMSAYLGQEAAIDLRQWPDFTDEQLRAAAAGAFAPGYRIPQTLLDQLRDMDLQVFAATSQAVPAYLNERGLPERLAHLGKPLLVLFGEQDQRWRPSSAPEYRVVPGALVVIMPEVGHSPPIEDPARTARILLSFTDVHTR
ncbi:alpha/beta fold hydrolase [Nocardia brasiliensis]|uniref:Alpha/beta hydrolase fold protein n=1 Tax=Nocardia brasiliensis (strain ATCC 700358 / HUJEG-1) TaxID=1133849 RepID=K0F889_NOCB7|nr:alpha/beta hydrolase [Nocardia brasiliensis]AFU03696.1 alpha/beta hydrolase fold protein [Nocardia brasiliensis ATCC 700358]OCF89566.1 alpha/beta hydrolase [Nocardia brasiliensis]